MHERIAVEKKKACQKRTLNCMKKNVIAGKWLWRKTQHEIFNFINLFFLERFLFKKKFKLKE